MKGFYRLKNGESIIVTAHDGEVIDPIERYMTRHLRREIFENLKKQPDKALDESSHLMMFGSSVIQYYRPKQGFPVRRRARDIDLGLVRDIYKNEDLSTEEQTWVNSRVSAAAINIGAQLTTDEKGKVVIRKVYSPEEVNAFLERKNEKSFGHRESQITIELEVSRTQLKTPLLKPIKLSDSFYMEEPKEVLGTKLMRMVSHVGGGFEIKDVMDFYNALSAGLIDVEKDANLLRGIALTFLSTANVGSRFEPTLENLEPSAENIENAMFIMGVDDKKFMTAVFETVYAATKKILGVNRQSNLPPHLAGKLNRSLDELNFETKLRGVEWQPGGRGNKHCPPSINPSLIFDADTLKRYPELMSSVPQKMELKRVIEETRKDANLRDF